MNKSIALLPGDGVGPEVVKQGVRVLEAIGKKFNHTFSFSDGFIGGQAIEKTGNPLPDETLRICKESDAILFGAIGDPKYDNDPSVPIRPEQGLLKLRQSLGLYANIRPIRIFPELISASPIKQELVRGTDFIVVRELTGGIYFGTPRERRNYGELAVDTCLYSREEVQRVARVAFQMSQKRSKKVTSVDKANVLETSRLWRETVTEMSKEFPTVALNHLFIDNAAMQIIKRPTDFDVIVTENMFGDILTDEASVITGSIGLLPSASLGDTYALYEPIHGAYNKAAGTDTANPIATILSVAMMLRVSFKMEKEAHHVEKAVEKLIQSGYRTKDLFREDEKTILVGTEDTGSKIASMI
jgi:3-isopropylmalate dehydrogenase